MFGDSGFKRYACQLCGTLILLISIGSAVGAQHHSEIMGRDTIRLTPDPNEEVTDTLLGAFGDEYFGNYEIPGTCGWPAVQLSPGLLEGGGVAWYYDIYDENVMIDELTSIDIWFNSNDLSLNPLHPYAWVYNWDDDDWEARTVEWQIPKTAGWHKVIEFGLPSEFQTYVHPEHGIRWAAWARPGNNLCVWYTAIQYEYVEKGVIRLFIAGDIPDHPNCPGVKTLEKDSSHTLSITLRNQHGSPVNSATLTIIDGISDTTDGPPVPFDTTLPGNVFEHTVVGGRPDTSKVLQITAYKEGYYNEGNDSLVRNVVVTGGYWREGPYSTVLPNFTPLTVLYDPPGDESYAFLEACTTYSGGFGMSVETQVSTEYTFHVGVSGPMTASIEEGENITFSASSEYEYSWAMTSGSRYETSSSSSPEVIGPGGGTHYRLIGWNLLYGPARWIAMDTSCSIVDTEVVSFEFDPDQSGVENIWVSGWEIEEDIMPPLPDSLKWFWQQVLDYDVARDNVIESSEEERLVCGLSGPVFTPRTWSANGGQEHWNERTAGHNFKISTKLEIEHHIAQEYGFDIKGITGGGRAVVSAYLALGGWAQGGIEFTNRIGYRLHDNDLLDQFKTRVYTDATFGTPVFINRSDTRTRCPWERFTTPNQGVMLENTDSQWEGAICPDTPAFINYRLHNTGLLETEFEISAPAHLNVCHAGVIFNHQYDDLQVSLDTGSSWDFCVEITPDCYCGINELTIRAQSSCDPQIRSDDVRTITCDYGLCPKAMILAPDNGDTISAGTNIIARTRSQPIDGMLFTLKEIGSGSTDTLCLDSDPDTPGPPWDYSCLWLTQGYPSDRWYRIMACIVEQGVPGQERDSIDVYLMYLPLLCGDINADGNGPNIADLTYLVAYLFGGGPPPPILEAADVNGGDGSINIADLTYLVAYLFGGGPDPDCG